MPFPSRIRLETRLPAALSEQDRGWTRGFGKLEGRDWLPTIIVALLILSLWMDSTYRSHSNSQSSTVSVSGTAVSQWNQSWDAAGRRSALNFQLAALGDGAGSQYGYQYNADGLLTSVANTGISYTYSYGDDGLLQERSSPLRTQTITERDSLGRITAENSACAGTTELSETMAYRADSRLSSYSVSGPVSTSSTETRTYGYDSENRLVSEPYLLENSTPLADLPNGQQTATSYFDQTSGTGSSVLGGLGVLTNLSVNANTGNIVAGQNGFKQVTADSYYPGNGSYNPWTLAYDSAGNITSRTIVSGTTIYQAQTLTWDAWGRLVKVSQRNTGTSDFDSTTVYDGLGRRVQTSWQPDNSGVPNGSPTPLAYYYDPQVEFLELGLNNNGDRTWWVYGPDRSGVYGGAQGEGGVENEIDEAGGFAYVPINNYFGDTLGACYVPTVVNPGYSITYGYGSALGGYGYEPGSAVYNLSLQWRGQYLDWTGFICQGARYYDYESGRFLSADPLGNAASMSLYDYCGGDPVNGLDPDGRCVLGQANAGPSLPPGVTYANNGPSEVPQPSIQQQNGNYTYRLSGNYIGNYPEINLVSTQPALYLPGYQYPDLYPNETTGGDIAQAVVNSTIAPIVSGLTTLQQAYGQLTGDPLQIEAGQVMSQMSDDLQNAFQADPYSNAYQVSYYSTMAAATVAGMLVPGLDEGAIAADSAEGGVYLLRDAEGTVVRTGRMNDLVRREAEHALDPELKDFEFETVFRTDNYDEQRGLEQLLHEAYAPKLNYINSISPANPNRQIYLDAAQKFLDKQ